jgi:hypothetical protein
MNSILSLISVFFRIFVCFNLVLNLDGQITNEPRLASMDTVIFEYAQDTSFMNHVKRVGRNLIDVYPAGTHIRVLSYGLGRFNFYFINPEEERLKYFELKSGHRKFIATQPLSIYNVPNTEKTLFFYYDKIFLVDKNHFMIQQWNHVKGYKGLYFLVGGHSGRVHDYILHDNLYFDIQLRHKYYLDSKVSSKYKVSPNIAFAYTPLSSFLKSRKIRIQDLDILTSNACADVKGDENWEKIIYADTICNELWYNSPDHEYLIRFNQDTKATSCFKLPAPIPPGLSYLSSYRHLNKQNFTSQVLKLNEEDTIVQLAAFPLHVYPLPHVQKILYSYYVVFDESIGDSIVLKDLHRNCLIQGKHWSEYRPVNGLFMIFQLFSIMSELHLDWQVMVPREYSMYPHSATESSITGLSSVPKDNYFVPALITWHLK